MVFYVFTGDQGESGAGVNRATDAFIEKRALNAPIF